MLTSRTTALAQLWLVVVAIAFAASRGAAQSAAPLQAPFEADPTGLNHSLSDLTDSLANDFGDPALAQDLRDRISSGTLVIGELEFRPAHDNDANRELYSGVVGKHVWWPPTSNGGVQVIGIDTRCSLAQAVARMLHELDHLSGCNPPPAGSPNGRTDPSTNTNNNPCADCNHAAKHAAGFNRLTAIECGEEFPTNLFPGLGDALQDEADALAHYLSRCAASSCSSKSHFTSAALIQCCEQYFQFPELCQ